MRGYSLRGHPRERLIFYIAATTFSLMPPITTLKEHLDRIAANSLYRSTLDVPNGTRKIFCTEGASLAKLDELRRELDGLVNDIKNDLSRSFRRLESARVEY